MIRVNLFALILLTANCTQAQQMAYATDADGKIEVLNLTGRQIVSTITVTPKVYGPIRKALFPRRRL